MWGTQALVSKDCTASQESNVRLSAKLQIHSCHNGGLDLTKVGVFTPQMSRNTKIQLPPPQNVKHLPVHQQMEDTAWSPSI